MANHIFTRAEDERDLDILDKRIRGVSIARIARQIGEKPNGVATRIRAIIEQDIKHDPEAASYWSDKT